MLAREDGTREAAVEFLASRIGPAGGLEELRRVIKVLAETGDARVPALLLAKWPGLSPEARGLVVDELLSRTEWTRQLLAAFGEGKVRPSELDAARRLRLANYPDKKLREEATQRLKGKASAARAEVVAAYRP
ncbi:MAG: hypothetical protein GWO24_31445, partial [Akkermansiaceae bacterium]|nr:hypothetical protein [Akkermansiaceae bacterium]